MALFLMADGKKSFVLYCDQKGIWDKLDDAQAGKLIKHIIAYVNDENPVAPDFITELAFEPIKAQLKRDLKKWEQTTANRSIAGKAGAEARWQKIADDGKRIQTMAKMAVNVNDNVTVNDNVINNTHLDKVLSSDCYLNGGDAWADITSDALFLERLVRIVRGTGATEENVLKATKYFLTLEDAKPNFDMRPRDEVKKHLVNWLNTQKKNVTTY
jgi:hypothetical protein